MEKSIKFNIPNLEEMVSNSLSKAFSEDEIQKTIDKCMKEVVTDTIESQFSYHSKVREQLKEHIKNSIGIDPEKLPVPEYTKLVAEGFRKALVGMEDDKLRKEAENLMESILQSAPKEIKLSEISKMYTDELVDKYDYELKEDKSVETEYEGDRVYNSYELCYEDELQFPDTSCLSEHKILTFSCPSLCDDEHRLVLSIRTSKDGKKATLSSAYRDKKYNSSVSEMEMKDWGTSSKLHKTLYKMCQANTVIIMDEGSVEEYFTIDLEMTFE